MWMAAAQIGASVLGNVFGSNAQKKADKRAHAFNMAQLQFQKDMAMNQIQWKTKDALAAGIHPLYAMGSVPYSASPIPYDGGSGGGEYMSQMGQDISRAIGAQMTERERRAEAMRLSAQATMERKQNDILFGQTVERNDLENKLLASQIARLNQPGTGPGMPEVENVGAGVVAVRPARTTSPSITTEGREAGAIRDYGFASTDDGGLAVVPSYDVHERIEDNFPQQLGWAFRNQLAPMIEGLAPPDPREHPLPSWAPRNARWRWNPLTQQFQPFVDTPRGGVWISRPRRRNR